MVKVLLLDVLTMILRCPVCSCMRACVACMFGYDILCVCVLSVLHPYEPELLQWEPSEDVLQPVKEQVSR